MVSLHTIPLLGYWQGWSERELQASFLRWVSSISEKLGIELIHIDGKTAKGSYDREGQLKAQRACECVEQ